MKKIIIIFRIFLDKIYIRKFLVRLLTTDNEKIYLSLQYTGFLEDVGWNLSLKRKKYIDKDSNQLPWYTYSFIEFLKLRLNQSLSIFEYGCGSSTFFYAKRVKEVTSVEHNLDWYNKIKSKSSKNIHLLFKDLNNEYSKSSLINNKKYDLIVIDGRDRVNSILCSTLALSKNGVIILDDSEREKYSKGKNYLINNGFKFIDFWGISPGYFVYKCTTVFYKSTNCFNI